MHDLHNTNMMPQASTLQVVACTDLSKNGQYCLAPPTEACLPIDQRSITVHNTPICYYLSCQCHSNIPHSGPLG